jgi:sulfatase maturation enzyme AslB (radical SAM superfamily)
LEILQTIGWELNKRFNRNYKGIRRVVTAMISGTACNMNCHYCYRQYHGVTEKNTPTHFQYSVPHMVKALHPKRLKGFAFILVVGGGETLLHEKIVPFIRGLLMQGHIVEVVTNLTLNERINELLDIPNKCLKNLIVKCSFHYMELKRLNKLEDYFNNLRKVVAAGASAHPFLVVSNDYLPYLDEIKKIFLRELQEMPHTSIALDFTDKSMRPFSFYTREFKDMLIKEFDSNVFRVTERFLDVDPKEYFCYAGDWCISLYTDSGKIQKCFYVPTEQNIFENIFKPIKFESLGKNCPKDSCALSYDLLSFGVLPDFVDLMPYGDVIFKKHLFNESIREKLNIKLYNVHKRYTAAKENKINIKVKEWLSWQKY